MLSRKSCAVLAVCSALVLPLLARAAAAQPPARVVDLNTAEEQETIFAFLAEPFASLDGELYFTADDGVHGVELWRTEGSGTVLVKDICPGACASLPRKLTRAGSRILFFAEDGEHGRELWATDGTAAGTSLVRDIRPGLASGADTFWMLEASGTVYFPAQDGLLGHELWKSDGTAAGTVLVKDLRPGPEGSLPVPHAAAGGTVLLDADDGVHGREPWLTDGTAAGTQLLADIRPGTGSSTEAETNQFNGKEWIATTGGLFLFQANDGTQGVELWASDGTEVGTLLVRDFYPGATGGRPFELTELAGTVYFTVETDAIGFELWRTDGTPAGTALVKDIRPGSGSSTPREITVFAGRLFFRASEEAHGTELWTSDGTEAGTTLVKDIATSIFGAPLMLTVVAGQLFFFADDGTNGESLWKSDGTEAGTVLVSNFGGLAFPTFPLFTTGALAVGSRFYCRLVDDAVELDLWVSDGTAAGTVPVQDGTSLTSSVLVAPWEGRVVEPSAWGALGGQLIYLADDGTSGNEPWVSDGTAAGTRQLAETAPGTGWSYFYGLTPLGTGSALFAAASISSTGALWTTDGTPAGTDLLIPTGGPAQVGELTRIGGTVFFSGSSAAEGQELWTTDGTADGTVLVEDILPGTSGSGPFRLTAVDNTLFFVANGGAGDLNQELWTSDGTADGTVLVEDIRPGEEPSEADHLTAVAGRLFFTADDGVSGREPWVSDGTAAGTFRVKDILPGPGASMAVPPVEGRVTASLGTTFFFVADDGTSGPELWASDGTEAGTRRVRDIRPGSRGSEPRWLTVAGGRLFFTADDGTHGRELWLSDGTEAGTVLVSDLLPGAGSSLPRELAAAGNVILFSATDGIHGVEPWASDGGWTRLLGDLAPGPLPSSPVRFTVSGDSGGTVSFFFAANDGTSGFELWNAAVANPLDYYTVAPCRVIDTRPSAPLLTGQPRTFPVAGSCGIPAEARAVAVNLTAISPTNAGHLVAWPAGTQRPETSNLNYTPGSTRSNNGILALGSDGRIDVESQTFSGNGEVHFVLDVVGYFR